MIAKRRYSRRKHPNWPVRLVLLAVLFSFLIFGFCVPLFRFRMEATGHQRESWHLLTEMVLTHSMGWFLVLWVFFFGACLGSFLNVVAYRIPSGMTILGTSRCPWCLVPIQGKHNFPILGWLMLRGRCAACRLPIAARYVLVEIAAGMVLVWLAVAELFSNGTNLPGDHAFQIAALFRRLASGELNGLENYDWSLVRIFFIHCLLCYTLLTAALMRLDGFRLPRIWQVFHLIAALVWIAFWHEDLDFARADFQTTDRFAEWVHRFDLQVAGICLGGFLGYQFRQLLGQKDSGLIFAFSITGCTLGLAATLSVGLLFGIMLGLFSMTKGMFRVDSFFLSQPVFVVLFAVLLQIAGWRIFDSIRYWPNNEANSLIWLAYLLPLTLLVIVVTSIRNQRAIPTQKDSVETTGDSGSSSTQ